MIIYLVFENGYENDFDVRTFENDYDYTNKNILSLRLLKSINTIARLSFPTSLWHHQNTICNPVIMKTVTLF